MSDAARDREFVRIIRAVEIAGPSEVFFAGEKVALPADGPTPVVAGLQAHFYRHCYCRRLDDVAGEADATPADAFLAALAAANAGEDRWSAGWRITDILSSGQVIAGKAALSRPAWPGEFVSHAGPGIPAPVGASISLFAPRGSSVAQPGFYIAFSETLTDWHDQQDVVRLYWNVRASGAATLMRELTRTLNRFGLAFQFKCLSHPAGYPRTDAAVLYVARRHYRVTAQVLTELWPALEGTLMPSVPLFAKPLAAGLGLAEDPGTGESFGMHRCRLLAEAVWRAHEAGGSDRIDALGDVFRDNGLTLDRPYLNPGSDDDYPFPVPS
jgi:hypothetical protein